MLRLHHLLADDKGELSIARSGLILTIVLAVLTISLDAWLTLSHSKLALPNTIYALETTMFLAFTSWVTGPRMASFIAPQIGSAATALANATRRDSRLPSRDDDEREGGE